MQTTICFDFGNTRLKFAVFKNADLADVVIMDSADAAAIKINFRKISTNQNNFIFCYKTFNIY
jgi:pantothenate kinase type III